MTSHDLEAYFRQHRRLLAVLLLMVCIAAVSGVFVGMRQTTGHAPLPAMAAQEHAGDAASNVPQAPRYGQIPDAGWLANDDWEFTMDQLPQAQQTSAAVEPLSAVELLEILEARAGRRAFDGAPPVIPHRINTISAASCIVCHDSSSTLVIDGTRPPVMSHSHYANCTQCHVPTDGLRGLTEDRKLTVDSAFDGSDAPGPGCRAYAGAPPTMPHRVFMRENCMACHGADRPNAIRSSHPQRQNCMQCHAQDSQHDNRERLQTPHAP